MIEEKKEGLKVAYRGAPTEEEIKAILRKRRIAQTVLTVLFITIAAIVGWYAYNNRAAILGSVQPASEKSTSTE